LLALERGLQLRPADPGMLSRRVMALVRLAREEDAEDLAADCVARFPAAVELHLTYAVLPFYFAKRRTAFVRLVAFTKAFPDSWAGSRRLADVTAGLYRYKDALASLDELMRRHKRTREAVQPLRDELAALAEAQVIASAECGPPGIAAMPMDIYVINMDHDQARLDTMAGWYSDVGLHLQRIGAVRARYLPALLMRRIADTAKVAVGTVGCFLSHIAAWETVSVAERPALILEDDACPTFRFSDDVSRVDLPEDFDVCFVNKRLALHTPLSLAGLSRIPALPIRDVVMTRSPGQRGVGCDGYILPPRAPESSSPMWRRMACSAMSISRCSVTRSARRTSTGSARMAFSSKCSAAICGAAIPPLCGKSITAIASATWRTSRRRAAPRIASAGGSAPPCRPAC
jgi:hypothetical protein